MTSTMATSRSISRGGEGTVEGGDGGGVKERRGGERGRGDEDWGRGDWEAGRGGGERGRRGGDTGRAGDGGLSGTGSVTDFFFSSLCDSNACVIKEGCPDALNIL